MNWIFAFINNFSLLFMITAGAISSEYAGRLALFLEGAINFGAFFSYAFSIFTGNAVVGIVLGVTLGAAAVLLLERIAARMNSNMFIVSLAMNLFFSSSTSLFSAVFFNSRGVLYSDLFRFNQTAAKGVTSVLCLLIGTAILLMIFKSKTGLILRVSGTDSDVLEAKGINSSLYKSLSWIVAGVAASFGGACLALRLSAFVPSMAAGKGWTALAAVYLGRKKPMPTIIAVAVFSASELLSTSIQNIEAFANLPTSVLLSLPYVVSLILIALAPKDE